MKKRLPIWLFFTVVFLIPVSIYAIVNWYEENKGALPVLGQPQIKNGKKTDHTIADFAFMNENGETVNLHKWQNKIVVADFFFTHCPGICPKITANLKKVQNAFVNNPDVLIASFTVDPERDSAQRLQAYSRQFTINNNNWDLLTGEKKELYKLARKSFFITATDGDGGPNDFIHSDQLVLIDSKQRIRGYYTGTVENEVQQLIKDINKLKHEN